MKSIKITKLLVLFALLTSCVQTPTTPTLIEATATPRLNQEKWMNYQQALSQEILDNPNGQCEWKIIGQSDQEVYVWTVCLNTTAGPGEIVMIKTNAIIHLGVFSSIESVEAITSIVDAKVPPDIKNQMLEQSKEEIDAMWSHLLSRQKKPEPPLIVLSGTPLP